MIMRLKNVAIALLFPALTLLPVFTYGKNITINSNEYAVDTIVYKHKVGPGVQYAQYRVPGRPLDIYVLETEIHNPYITLEVWNGMDKAVAGETPSHRYQAENRPGHDVVAAHNGDFYTVARDRAGISRMGLIGAGQMMFNTNGKALFVLDSECRAVCGTVDFAGTVKISSQHKSTRLHTVNQLRLEWEPATDADRLSLFTNQFGTELHPSTEGGKVAIIAPVEAPASYPVNTTLYFKVVSVNDKADIQPIPEGHAVLHGLGTSAKFLAGLSAGEDIEIYLGCTMPDYPEITRIREAVGGSNHIILRNGDLCHINSADLHPRTFMGISQDGNTVYSVVIDGRSDFSAGIDLDDQGRVLQWLGAWDGVNLDGGGSSSMVIHGSPVNRTSDGPERAVGNGVLFYSTAPVDDAIAEIAFEPRSYRISLGEELRPTLYGYNKYGVLKTRQTEGVTLTCDPQVGHINEDGIFVATDNEAHGYIYATYKGVSCRQEVKVLRPAEKLIN